MAPSCGAVSGWTLGRRRRGRVTGCPPLARTVLLLLYTCYVCAAASLEGKGEFPGARAQQPVHRASLALPTGDPAALGGCTLTRRLLHALHLGAGSGCSGGRTSQSGALRSLLNFMPPGKWDRFEPSCRSNTNRINQTADVACYGNDTYRAANPKALGMCCESMNFWCGVQSDTGGPRCRTCPGTCIMTCQALLGHSCQLDLGNLCRPGGAWDCLSNCTATSQCSGGRMCHQGFCHSNPCPFTACPAETPVCRAAADTHAVCEAPGVRTCGDADLCPSGSFCDAGVCQDLCAATACPSETPACRIRPNGTAACEALGARTCSADDPCPSPDQLCTAEGTCRTNPCTSNACAPGTPTCTVGPAPDYAAVCTAECSGTLPCPAGKLCAGGACRPSPCTGKPCPKERPICSVGPPPLYTAVCSAVPVPQSQCSPACLDGALCVKSGGASSKWQCIKRPLAAKALRRVTPSKRTRK